MQNEKLFIHTLNLRIRDLQIAIGNGVLNSSHFASALPVLLNLIPIYEPSGWLCNLNISHNNITGYAKLAISDTPQFVSLFVNQSLIYRFLMADMLISIDTNILSGIYSCGFNVYIDDSNFIKDLNLIYLSDSVSGKVRDFYLYWHYAS